MCAVGKRGLFKSFLVGVVVFVFLFGCVEIPPNFFSFHRETVSERNGSGFGQSVMQNHSKGMVSLENFDWHEMPSWYLINASAKDLERKNVSFLKGAVAKGLWIGERGYKARQIIEDNFSMKERINVNVYEIRLTFVYRNGQFKPPGPDFETVDNFLRATMSDGVLAKKKGLAVHLSAGFFPEKGFKNKQELVNALNEWNGIVAMVSELAEKYKFEYLNPCGELDHVIRMDSGIQLQERETVQLLNDYYKKYSATARKFFKGKLATQLGDVFVGVKDSVLDLNLSGFDLVGLLIGVQIDKVGKQQFVKSTKEAIGIMQELSKKQNRPWYISEVWIYGIKPANEKKRKEQAEFFKSLFEILESSEVNCSGILIMNWNMEEESIFANIKDSPAEKVISEYFSTK